MTEQELVQLEIERRAYLAVVREFTIHDCDARMEVGLDKFLRGLENKAREIQQVINQNT